MFLLNWAIDNFNIEDIVVAHVNYKTREQSDKEQSMIESFCSERKIKYEVLVCTDEIYANYDDIKNFQKQARVIRYDFFKKVALESKTSEIYIAHNKDDFLETAIMLEERSSKYFYYGIKERNVIDEITLIRPMLNIWKEDITTFLDKNEIPYFVDHTNNLPKYTRNTLRIKLSDKTLEWKNDEINRFRDINSENSLYIERLEAMYSDWRKKFFSSKYLIDVKAEEATSLVYMYLMKSGYDLNITFSKVVELVSFIQKTGNEWKEFRLSNNIYITKQNQLVKLKIIS